jgi:D-aspartate ligase
MLRARRSQVPRGEPRACVLGDIDLVRALALAGIRSVVVARRDDPLRYSRFADPSLAAASEWTEREQVVDELMRFGLSEPVPPVLFYQGTASLLTVSRHRDRLAKAFRFPLADAELVEQLTDKASFQALAERLGLPVPRSRRMRPSEDPAGPPRDLRYPLILKPVVRRLDQWRRIDPAAKAVKVDGVDALTALWPRLAAEDVEVLAQELVVGPESMIESYHTYVGPSGDVIAEFTGRKIRTRPIEFGNSTTVTITSAPDVASLGRAVVRRLGLIGVAKLDFKRAPDRRLLLLEVNPRFTLWHHPAAVAGLNIPAIVFADLTGGRRPPIRSPRAGVRWCDIWEDAAAARSNGELGPRWLASTLTCGAKSGFARDDPMPFVLGMALPRIRTHLRRRVAR